MLPSKALEQVRQVLSKYRLAVASIEPLGGAGGFSGAEFWRVRERSKVWCLRCWPKKHPRPDRLVFIHAVLASVARQGLDVVALPESSHLGETFVSSGGQLWELTRWMPGAPVSRKSVNARQLSAAMDCLAKFHVYASDYQKSFGTAPGIVERCDRIVELQRGLLPRILDACRQPPWPELAGRVEPIICAFQQHASRVLQRLLEARACRVPVQPCIRDVWSDHVLFTDDEITGLIDFGAMRLDHVSADIARLLGSLVGDEKPARLAAVEAYSRKRPLNGEEQHLLHAYDTSSTLLSGMNWLQWICLEQRHFPCRRQVIQRLDENIQRLAGLADA